MTERGQSEDRGERSMSEMMERRAENGGGGGLATDNNHEAEAFSLTLIAKVRYISLYILFPSIKPHHQFYDKNVHCNINMSLVEVVG